MRSRFPVYAVISVVCALANNVLVIAFARMGFHYVAATCLAFGPVLLGGYALHAIFTFRTFTSWSTFARYTLSMLANVPAWFVLLFIFCSLLSFSVTVAAPIATVMLFLWNYLASRWAFRSFVMTLPSLRFAGRQRG